MITKPTLISAHATIGIEIVIAILLGLWLGTWLDQHWAIAPWGTMAGFTVGIGAAIKALTRFVRQARRQFDPPPATEPQAENDADATDLDQNAPKQPGETA